MWMKKDIHDDDGNDVNDDVGLDIDNVIFDTLVQSHFKITLSINYIICKWRDIYFWLQQSLWLGSYHNWIIFVQ